jgi:hypothetical protein
MIVEAEPECKDGASLIYSTCNVFAKDGDALEWATIDFQYPVAKVANFVCTNIQGDTLAGVRCLAGDGFTATRYNVWECLEECD